MQIDNVGAKEGRDKTWGEFYGKPASIFFVVRDIIVHLRYLCTIILKRPERILEIGTGTSIHSIFLGYFIKDVTAVDSNREVVASSKSNIKRSKSKVKLVLADAFSIPFRDKSFDICYSQGFLEHFTDDEISRLFKEELRVSKLLVHSVPSDHYPWRQFGDERHLPLEIWRDLLTNCIDGIEDLAVNVKYGYLPLVNWYIIMETMPQRHQ